MPVQFGVKDLSALSCLRCRLGFSHYYQGTIGPKGSTVVGT